MTNPSDTAAAALKQRDTCATCRWIKPDGRPGYEAHGFCRRYPPQVVAIDYGTGCGTSVENCWPWMAATDRCGEHSFSGRAALSNQQGGGE